MSGTNRLRELTRAQRAAVMEKAIELSERPSATDTEAWVAAAAELGIEREVLLEAQQSLERDSARAQGAQTRQDILDASHARQRLRKLAMMGVVAAGALAVAPALLLSGGSSQSGSFDALKPFSSQVAEPPNRWSVWSEAATLRVGKAVVEGQPAIELTLSSLSSSGIANYRTTRIHGDLTDLERIDLEIWSDGLTGVQPTLRRSKHAQWSLPPVHLQPGKNDLVVKLNELRYQERAGKGKPWKSKGSRPMRDVEMFQLKLGKNVNKAGSAGSLQLVRIAVQ